MGVLGFIVKKTPLQMKIDTHFSAEMITDDLFLKFIPLLFSHDRWLPSSLLEVISKGDRM